MDFQEVMESLNNCMKLEKGWDSYSAPPPSDSAIDNARDFIIEANKLGVVPSRLSASAVGGVGITFRPTRMVYVEFHNKGTSYALFSDGGEVEKIVEVDSSLYQNFIESIHEFLGK